jgi:hypothetical protein
MCFHHLLELLTQAAGQLLEYSGFIPQSVKYAKYSKEKKLSVYFRQS